MDLSLPISYSLLYYFSDLCCYFIRFSWKCNGTCIFGNNVSIERLDCAVSYSHQEYLLLFLFLEQF